MGRSYRLHQSNQLSPLPSVKLYVVINLKNLKADHISLPRNDYINAHL